MANFFTEQSTPFKLSQVGEVAGLIIPNVPCDSSVYVNAAVRMDATGTAYNALADSMANAQVIGIVISKASTTLCTIRVLGVTEALFAGLDVTKEYYLSSTVAGEIQTSAPLGSGEIVLRVGQPYSATKLLVNKGTAFRRA